MNLQEHLEFIKKAENRTLLKIAELGYATLSLFDGTHIPELTKIFQDKGFLVLQPTRYSLEIYDRSYKC